jgi:hypothetical protein
VTRLEYIRSCQEIWEKGLFLQLGAYQHHAFLDWHFVDGDGWQAVAEALAGGGVDSVRAQWQRMFEVPPIPGEGVEVAAANKPARKRAAKKSTGSPQKKSGTAAKKASSSKTPSTAGAKKVSSKKASKKPAKPAKPKTASKSPAKKKPKTGS